MDSFKLDTSDLSSWNGIGLTLYGKDKIEEDGSYVATKWFILFLLPIIPLGSYRVLVSDSRTIARGAETSYLMTKTDFNTGQVIKTYLIGWSIGIAIFLVLNWISMSTH